jgi:hypothetical protein
MAKPKQERDIPANWFISRKDDRKLMKKRFSGKKKAKKKGK